jgi:hypothetical protein
MHTAEIGMIVLLIIIGIGYVTGYWLISAWWHNWKENRRWSMVTVIVDEIVEGVMHTSTKQFNCLYEAKKYQAELYKKPERYYRRVQIVNF